MSKLSQAMVILKTTFDKYAGREGDKNSLTKKELAELLRNEFPSEGEAAENNFFSMLDDDNDGVVNFMEYVNFVAAFTVMKYEK